MISAVSSRLETHVGAAHQALQFGCRLFAYMAPQRYKGQDTFIRQCLVEGDNSMRAQSMLPPDDHYDLARLRFGTEKVQDDGWGLAFFKRHARLALITKAPKAAHADAAFTEASKAAAKAHPEILLAHLREGENIKMANTHPFQLGKWVFMHNGNVPERSLDYLNRQLLGYHQRFKTPLPQGDTDTERVFLNLMGRLQVKTNAQSPEKMNPSWSEVQESFRTLTRELIRRSMREDLYRFTSEDGKLGLTLAKDASIRKTAGLNFVLSDGKRILASCFGRPLYLGVRRNKDGNAKEALLASRRIQPTQASGQAHIEWYAIPNGHMVTLQHRLGRIRFHIEPL